MRRWKWIAVGSVMPLVLAVTILAAGPNRYPMSAGTQIIDNVTYFDANTLLMFVTNTGSIAYDKTGFLGKSDGLYFPKGTNKTVIFAGGIWMGAKVGGNIRVAVAEYSNEFVPGPMADGKHQTDVGRFRVYKLNKGDTPENNPDYANWPTQDGAPVDANGNPLIQGDQALWAVFNDADPATHSNMSSQPLGVEVQSYVFGYARAGALGQTIFVRYKIINKGSNLLEDTYISLWADPDLGDAGDDFVGCDTALSLGYCYNDGDDDVYGSRPPAVGYDFFQGPIVPAPGDSAWVSSKGVWIQDYMNLPMTSFNQYINGTDPHTATETYNYMQGLQSSGAPQIDPNGITTKFMLAGDPVAGTGWLDANAADRRYMMSTGPFTMAPGDTQEVVAAVVVGQGENRLASITELKRVDEIAQNTFDLNFDIPGPPPQPSMWAVPHDGAGQLFWGQEADGDIQYGLGPVDEFGNADTLQTFVMEGINIYQGESSSGPWTLIATYDVNNGVQRLYQNVDNPLGIETVVVQKGSDSGLDHELWITADRVGSGRLINNKPYYFTVTSYNYDEQNAIDWLDGQGLRTEVFENLPGAVYVEMIPRSMTGILADTATHTAGISDGSVLIDYIDQNAITGDSYLVDFNEDGSWNLTNTSTNDVLFTDLSSIQTPQDAEGFIVRVLGPAFGVKGIVETMYGGSAVDPPDNVMYSLNSTGDYYISSDAGSNFARLNWQGLIGIDDWEIRFTDEGSEYYNFSTDEIWDHRAPFEVWNLGPGTISDESDDRRLQFANIDDDESGGWSMGDRIYVSERDYVEPHPAVMEYDFPADFHIGRIVVNDNSGAGPPPSGTTIRFVTNKPNQQGDEFVFTSNKPGTVDGTAIAESVADVHPVPNPYYNVSPLEVNQFERKITFVQIPAAKTTIRIFNLAGDLVRTLIKDDPGSGALIWNTLTETGIPVASGLYIYHVEAEGIGTKVGKMAVFTEVEQLDQF